jgi:hypothetical protein
MATNIETMDFSTIAFSKQKVKSANKFIYVYSQKKALKFRLPKMRLPFGLQKDTMSKKNQYLVDFSFENNSKLLESFQKFDAFIISKVHQEFFPEKTIETVKAMYSSYLKYPENPMFSPTLRSKIIVGDDDTIKCEFYENEQVDGKYPKVDIAEKGNGEYLTQVMGKGSHNQSIIECIGLWFFGDKFGLSFKVTQVMLYHPEPVEEKEQVDECQFVDTDTDTSNSEVDYLGE